MKKRKIPQPRNPFVQHLVNKSGAGVHGKNKKAERSQQKAELRKQLRASAESV